MNVNIFSLNGSHGSYSSSTPSVGAADSAGRYCASRGPVAWLTMSGVSEASMKDGCASSGIGANEAGENATVDVSNCSPACGSTTAPVGCGSGASALATGSLASGASAGAAAVAAIIDSLRTSPDSVPQPPSARPRIPSNSAACRISNPKRTVVRPFDRGVVWIMISGWWGSTAPAPWEQSKCQSASGASIGYAAPSLQALSLRWARSTSPTY